jgi:hypothetical protein
MRFALETETGLGHGFIRLMIAVLLGIAGIAGLSSVASAQGPTCSDVLAIENHGHHIVGDYVTGIGHPDFDWPPAGSVGAAVGGNGAAAPGASGVHAHGGGAFQPGASFCNPQANSPTGNTFPGRGPQR